MFQRKFLLLFGPEQLSAAVSSESSDWFFYKRNRLFDSSLESNLSFKISLIFTYFSLI